MYCAFVGLINKISVLR